MPHLKTSLINVAVVVATATLSNVALADTAEAQVRERSRTMSVQGPVRGATFQQDRVRSPGFASRDRQVTTNSGRTFESSRQRRTIRTEDGFETSASRTGPRGGTQTYDRSTTRTEDGYARLAEIQTSSGGGYTAARDVSRSEDDVVVDRNVTTNNGSTFNGTSTYSRPE